MKNIRKGLILSSVLFIIGCSNSDYYKVKNGDTLYNIAIKNDMTLSRLKALNNIEGSQIYPGQRLRLVGSVPPISEKDRLDNSSSGSGTPAPPVVKPPKYITKKVPQTHTVSKDDTLYNIAKKYSISVPRLMEYNDLQANDIYIGQKLIYGYKEMKVREDVGLYSPTGTNTGTVIDRFGSPLKSLRVNSKYGTRVHPVTGKTTFHEGIDLKAVVNTPIYAPYQGVVTYSGWMNGYGKIIIIDHGNGVTTRYGHLNKLNVGVGTKVKKGQYIAKSGSTGRVTGPHLHYEIRIDGKPIDPTPTLF